MIEYNNLMHDHKPVYSETFSPNQEIYFHGKLREWLTQYWNLSDTATLHIQEIGCDDNSCPVFETLVVATEDQILTKEEAISESYSQSHQHSHPQKPTDSDNNQMPRIRVLRLGKAKHLLTKQDIYYSIEKQKK